MATAEQTQRASSQPSWSVQKVHHNWRDIALRAPLGPPLERNICLLLFLCLLLCCCFCVLCFFCFLLSKYFPNYFPSTSQSTSQVLPKVLPNMWEQSKVLPKYFPSTSQVLPKVLPNIWVQSKILPKYFTTLWYGWVLWFPGNIYCYSEQL